MGLNNFGDELFNGAKEAGEHIIRHVGIEASKNSDQIIDTVIDTASDVLDVVADKTQEGLELVGSLFCS